MRLINFRLNLFCNTYHWSWHGYSDVISCGLAFAHRTLFFSTLLGRREPLLFSTLFSIYISLIFSGLIWNLYALLALGLQEGMSLHVCWSQCLHQNWLMKWSGTSAKLSHICNHISDIFLYLMSNPVNNIIIVPFSGPRLVSSSCLSL